MSRARFGRPAWSDARRSQTRVRQSLLAGGRRRDCLDPVEVAAAEAGRLRGREVGDVRFALLAAEHERPQRGFGGAAGGGGALAAAVDLDLVAADAELGVAEVEELAGR